MVMPTVARSADWRRAFRFVRRPSARIGLASGGLVVTVALIGPFFAPYSPSQPVGLPFSGPSSDAIFGSDFLGRDVLSRVLWGGRTMLGLSIAATMIAYAIGLTIGLVSRLPSLDYG